jgi:hypothetical protein
MKFWLCISLLLAGQSFPASRVQITPHMALQGASKVSTHGANELLLAGLRPGRDTVAMAEKQFKAKDLIKIKDRDSETKEWLDGCSGRAIRLELNDKSVIQSITITTLASRDGPCGKLHANFLRSKNWVTGHGLHIGDSQDRVIKFYGEPNSSGPAVKNGNDLELMFYQFDWAGSDVPQVMEVLCARDTGRVVEITLAFPSL